MKSIIMFFVCSLVIPFFITEEVVIVDNKANTEITIEILNKEALDFDFSIKHEVARKQIQIRSKDALRSLRLMDGDKKKKSYSIIGSNLVVLPMTDFVAGDEHILEIKFLTTQQVIVAKLNVPEDYPMALN